MNTWSIDSAHSAANFKVQHRGIAWVTGQMVGIKGEINFDTNNIEGSSFKGSIDASSINTGLEMRDGHLKSDDFFNVEQYPEIKFESTAITKLSDTKFKMDGSLTIRDVTKDVTWDVEYLGETEKQNEDGSVELVSAFSATTKIDRTDYGLNWNMELPGGSWLVGNDIKIEVNLEATRAK
jgi:polyisoprenoid-binding protein YceI